MYQRNSELEKLQQEKASVEKKVEQLQHNQQRLENRKSYYEKADRKKRTHRRNHGEHCTGNQGTHLAGGQ